MSRTHERGFTLTELIVVMAIAMALGTMALGVTGAMARSARAEGGAQQLDAFLRRHRETAIARRRDIEIRFEAPNRVVSLVRAIRDDEGVMGPATALDNLVLEGRVRYQLTPGVPDTPNGFGNGLAVNLGGATPVMFSSEGAFIDANNNPVNATLSLGIPDEPLSATAVTIMGPTATIERWRWNGSAWAK